MGSPNFGPKWLGAAAAVLLPQEMEPGYSANQVEGFYATKLIAHLLEKQNMNDHCEAMHSVASDLTLFLPFCFLIPVKV